MQEKSYDFDIYESWLHQVPGIGSKSMDVLLDGDIKAKDLYFMNEQELRQYVEHACSVHQFRKGKIWENIKMRKGDITPEEAYGKMRESGILYISKNTDAYPKKLRNIPDEPYGIYVMDRIGSLHKNKIVKDDSGMTKNIDGLHNYIKADIQMKWEKPTVAVIGARMCSEYGRYIANRIGTICARMGICVVSGMAAGIDGIAERAAIVGGGCAISVLGCGVDYCYPLTNRDIYEHSFLVSEYAPGTEAKAQNFPARNRIISGLADAVIVVEAKKHSGTLITVGMALEQGREVHVVPGRITDTLSFGCNRLVYQGAELIYDLEETLAEILFKAKRRENGQLENMDKGEKNSAQGRQESEHFHKNPYDVNSIEYGIYSMLDLTPFSVQEIYEKVNIISEISISELQNKLLQMELAGNIREVDGGYCKNI